MKKLTKVIFTLGLLVTSLPVAAAYSDVGDSHSYFDAIDFLSSQDIVSGYPDGTYQPARILNRAELLKIVIEAKHTDSELKIYSTDNCFDDVPSDDWYTKYVCFAKDKGIVDGYSDGNFRPSDEINLVEATKIAMEVFNYSYEVEEPWFKGFIDEASKRNFLPLEFKNFDQTMNRGQMADLMTRMLKFEDSTLDDYLGSKSEKSVNYISLNHNLDFSEISTATFDDPLLDVHFSHPAEWPLPLERSGGSYSSGGYTLAEESNWLLDLGPLLEGACEGTDCFEFHLQGYESKNSSSVLEELKSDEQITLIEDFKITEGRILVYEESGICQNLNALIFLGDQTFHLKANCVDGISKKNTFYTLLSELTTFTESLNILKPELDPEDPKDPEDSSTKVTTPAPPSDDFTVFESSSYNFFISYPKNWYYRGFNPDTAGVLTQYDFSSENPYGGEDPDVLEEVEIQVELHILSISAPEEKIIFDGTKVEIYANDGTRDYRLVGDVSFQSVMQEMADSIISSTTN